MAHCIAQNTWAGRLRPLDKSSFDSLTSAPVALCCVATNIDAPQENLVCFEYLNSGAANIVFKILPWSPRSGSRAFTLAHADRDGSLTPVHRDGILNQVLRISKGVPKSVPCEDILSSFEHDIRPLFSPIVPPGRPSATITRGFEDHLMDHQGVLLSANVLAHLFAQYNTTNKSAALSTPTSARWGILLPDMSPDSGSITIEIKPKWLSQSPNAPKDAIRCRTCALRASRSRDIKGYVCPMRLVGGPPQNISPWVRANVMAHYNGPPKAADKVVNRLLEYLTTGEGKSLLQYLKALQANLDPYGILYRDRATEKISFDRNLRLAMSLRDCSLFINIPYNTSSSITSKLADLDFKSAAKISDWELKEKKLRGEGWYTRRDVPDYGCLLAQN